MHSLTLSLPRLINLEFPLQPRQKYYITLPWSLNYFMLLIFNTQAHRDGSSETGMAGMETRMPPLSPVGFHDNLPG